MIKLCGIVLLLISLSKSTILNFKGDVEGGERSAENRFCLAVQTAVPTMISKCHFSSLEIDNTLLNGE